MILWSFFVCSQIHIDMFSKFLVWVWHVSLISIDPVENAGLLFHCPLWRQHVPHVKNSRRFVADRSGDCLARWFVGMLKPKEHGEDDRIVSQDCMLDTKGKLTRLTIRQSENEWQGSTRALRKSSLDVSTCFKPKRSPQYNLACIFFTFYILAAIWMWEEFHNIRKRLRKEQLSPCGSLAIDARCSLTRVGVETCGLMGGAPL